MAEAPGQVIKSPMQLGSYESINPIASHSSISSKMMYCCCWVDATWCHLYVSMCAYPSMSSIPLRFVYPMQWDKLHNILEKFSI